MSQKDQDETKPTVGTANDPMPPAEAPPAEPGTAEPGAEPDANAPTIGTGTSIALGCVAGTILLIAIGLIYILILALL